MDLLLNCSVTAFGSQTRLTTRWKLHMQVTLYIISKGSEILPIAVQGPRLKSSDGEWHQTLGWLPINHEHKHWQCKDCCKIFVKQCLKLTHGGEAGGKEIVHTQDQREKSRKVFHFRYFIRRQNKEWLSLDLYTHTHTHPDTLWLVNMEFFQVNGINIFFYPMNKVTDDKKQSNIFSILQNSNLISKVFSRYCQDLYNNEIVNNNDFKIYWLALKY